MQPVTSLPTFPEDILNLHDALQALMPPKSDCFKPAGDWSTRDDLVKAARYVGMEGEKYGNYTLKAVAFFQKQEGIEPIRSGEMDRPTADRMNAYLEGLGVFDDPDQRVVFGRVTFGAGGEPATGTSVVVFDDSGTRAVVFNRGNVGGDGRYELPFAFPDGQKRWVGVPLAAGGFDPRVPLGRDKGQRIEADLVVPAAAATLDFGVQGVVRRAAGEPDGGTPLGNIVVSVFTASDANRRLAQSPATVADGAYTIRSTAPAGATLFVAIESGNGFAVRSSSWTNAGGSTTRDLELSGAADAGAWVVRGRVTGAVPAAGVVVRAFDKDIRSEELLGECVPGSDGQYEIRFQSTDFARAEKPGSGPEPRLRVFAGNQQLPATATPAVDLFNAPQVMVIDLEIADPAAADLSEFERHMADIEPVRDMVAVADFTDADVAFVAGETGIDPTHVAWLAQAAKSEADLRAGKDRDIPARFFYGWLREGSSGDIAALLQAASGKLLDLLRAAIADAIIPVETDDALAALGSVLDELRATGALAGAGAGQPASLGDVLGALATPLAGDLSQAIVKLLAEAAPEDDLSDRIASLKLPAAQFDDVRNLLVLRRIAEGHQPTLAGAAGAVRADTRFAQAPPTAAVAGQRAADWQALLTKLGTTPPDGQSIADWSASLERRTAATMPTDFLMAAGLRAPDAAALSGTIDAGDAAGLLPRLTRRFDGLGLADVFAADNSAQTRGQEARRRIDVFNGVYARHPDLDFLALDYMPGGSAATQISFDGVAEADRPLVLGVLKAHQRVQQLTGHAQDSERLLEAGYASAQAVLDAGTARLASDTGFDVATAGNVMLRAQDIVGAVVTSFAYATMLAQNLGYGLNNTTSGGQKQLAVSDFFTQIPGFADLFGRQSTCRCLACQSVLSPAAYFVDLMWFVETRLTRVAYAGQALPPFSLRGRRPDLWTLTLDCAGTDTLVPTLDIVNGLLEQHIARAMAAGTTAAQVYAKLALEVGSFAQPFSLPLTRIGLLLGHFLRTRAEVARALGTTDGGYARIWLGLSLIEWDLVVRSRTSDIVFLRQIYGAGITDNLTPAKQVDVQLLLACADWTRDELGQLLACDTVLAGAAVVFQSTKSTPDAVQNDLEVVSGLTLAVLDRLHRFERLRKAAALTPRQLDELLLTLTPVGDRMAEAPVVSAGLLLDLHARFALDAEELCALVGPLPRTPKDGTALFDRLFNLQPFVDQQGPWPAQPVPQFTHPAFAPSGSSTPDNRTLQRLLAGLQVSDADLVALLSGLGLASAAAPAVALSEANLTLLYRHARAARLLGIEARDLLDLMRCAGVGAASNGKLQLQSVDHLLKLVVACDQWQGSGYTLEDAAFILDGVATTPSQPRSAPLCATVVDRLQRELPFEFSETVLSSIPGLSEDSSRKILALNTATSLQAVMPDSPLEQAPGSSMLRLRAGADPGAANWTLRIPPDVTLPAGTTAQDVAALLRPYDPLLAVRDALASAMDIPADKLDQLLALCLDAANRPLPLSAARAAIVDAAYRGDAAALDAAVFTPRATLLRLVVLFGRAEWTAGALVAMNHGLAATPAVPLVFDDAATVVLAWAAVVEAGAYTRIARAAIDADDPQSAASAPARIAAALVAARGASAADDGLFAAALRVDTLQVSAVRRQLRLPQGVRPIDVLVRLSDALALAASFGASGETLAQMVPDVGLPAAGPTYLTNLLAAATSEYATLSSAVDGLYAIVRITYPDEATFQATIEPFDDISRGLRRDALVDFLLHPSGIQDPLLFSSTSDLLGYFLMDVEIGGCARTSAIVAATLSVQLYVHRVLMQLEQGMWQALSDDQVRQALADVASQWDWRQHYRVWEANRKIFLYPENYLEPDLRDDKTPGYAEFEDALAQQEISDDSATDAYSRYLAGFETLARLAVVGAFHDVGTDAAHPQDKLHLLGMTNEDPPVYYLRTLSQILPDAQLAADYPSLTYGAWRKLDVQIPVPYATPIVIDGRLHVLWLEISTTAKNKLVSGQSLFVGYQHRFKLKFTSLKANGAWTPPQDVSLSYNGIPLPQTLADLLDPPPKVPAPAPAPATSSGSTSGSGNASNFDPVGTGTVVVVGPPPKTKFLGVVHRDGESMDNYLLRGPVWNKVYAEVQVDPATKVSRIILGGIGQESWGLLSDSLGVWGQLYGRLDLFAKDAASYGIDNARGHLPKYLRLAAGAIEVMTMTGEFAAEFDNRFSYCAMPLREKNPGGTSQSYAGIVDFRNAHPVNRVGRRPWPAITPDVPLDAVLTTGKHTLMVRISPNASGPQTGLVSLGTTLRDVLSRQLFSGGLPGLLDTGFQSSLVEAPLPLANTSTSLLVQKSVGDPMANAYGVYFRELLFDMPYATAMSLNAQQRFAAAQRWFHYLFDPTSADTGPDRVWRYREFRGVTLPSLRDALTNPAAIAAYQNDPFNPYAIARLRPGTRQRAVVMRYIDNLLDWGDSLFTEFTMESLNEATMLYVLANDILGPRPADVGDCGEGGVDPRDYEQIELHALDKGSSEFLVELELVSGGPRTGYNVPDSGFRKFYDLRLDLFKTEVVQAPARDVRDARALAPAGVDAGPVGLPGDQGMFGGLGGPGASTPMWRTAGGTHLPASGMGSIINPSAGGARLFSGNGPVNPGNIDPAGPAITGGVFGNETLIPVDFRLPPPRSFIDTGNGHSVIGTRNPPGIDFAKQVTTRVPIFCVPANDDLLAYWDRVEERLRKIRNCMDITGASRRPSLFAPEIDPALMARLRAAGLSLDDALAAGNASVPPYRFTMLIDKARQHVQTVQAFAGELLAAIERKDGEEMAQLRAVQEKNVLLLRKNILQLEIDAAEATSLSLQKHSDLLQFRQDYYVQLQAVGRIPEEQAEQSARSVSAALREQEAMLGILAGVLGLIPNLGAPMAITYGGVQFKGVAAGFLNALRSGGALADVMAEMSGREATQKRRLQEWGFQEKLAARELQEIASQIASAEARADSARRSLDVHSTTIDQADEMLALYRDKFTNYGMFSWLSTRLHRLHREAFNAALSMARMAERAYLFEREDDGAIGLSNDYWDAQNAGLGAADALLLDLHRLEQRFMETNFRKLEVEQSFSLAQWNPSALTLLRETGECAFDVPELFFDLAYPGHYRRRIRAVRMTLPCVVGPYTNVGATLRLQNSTVRKAATTGAAGLTDVPLLHSAAIATSSGQSDSGVFEFSFRDERYMPFEGAGAISGWSLALPRAARSFDYRSISDVILRIAYIAEADDGLRDLVDTQNGLVMQALQTAGLPRIVSLRHEFPDAWSRLVRGAPGTAVPLAFDERLLPFFLSGMTLNDAKFELLLRLKTGVVLTPATQFTLDDQPLGGAAPTAFGNDPDTACQRATTTSTLPVLGKHTLKVTVAGVLAPAAPATGALDDGLVQDVMLRFALVRKNPQP